MPDGPDELAGLERRRAELYAELGLVGDFRRGSLNEAFRKCGKPNCACAAPGAGTDVSPWACLAGCASD